MIEIGARQMAYDLTARNDGHIGQTYGEYSVWQFFANGDQECVRKMVSDEEAVTAAEHYCTSVAARFGTTVRVIITDAGDSTNFEWKRGEGVVYPPREG